MKSAPAYFPNEASGQERTSLTYSGNSPAPLKNARYKMSSRRRQFVLLSRRTPHEISEDGEKIPNRPVIISRVITPDYLLSPTAESAQFLHNDSITAPANFAILHTDRPTFHPDVYFLNRSEANAKDENVPPRKTVSFGYRNVAEALRYVTLPIQREVYLTAKIR